MCTHRTVAIRTPTCIFACARVPLYDSRDRSLSLSHSPSLFLSHSFSLSPPSIAPSFSFVLTLAHSLLLLFPTSRPPPLSTPSRIFYSFSHSLSPLCLRLTLLHSLPLCLPQTSSSVSSDRTVEAAQAAEGHWSQLWTYLDRRARSEVWTSFAQRPCRRC